MLVPTHVHVPTTCVHLREQFIIMQPPIYPKPHWTAFGHFQSFSTSSVYTIASHSDEYLCHNYRLAKNTKKKEL